MDSSSSLLGRVALVTGAGKRLGRAIALRLAAEGADIIVHYGRSQVEAEQVVAKIQELGRHAVALQADLTSVPAIRDLLQQTQMQFGRLDILINSAANFLQTKFGETTERSWDASLDSNLKAPFFCSQAAVPLLSKSGHAVIINISDIGGLLGWTDFLPHSISKAGVIFMTRVLARELAPEIRVNAIAPGTISMPGDPADWQSDYIRRAPLKRTGRPEEITDAILYLIGAEFITGQILVVDGGRTL